MDRPPYVVAITGASGAIYGIRLLEFLLQAKQDVYFTFSPAASQVIHHELGQLLSPDAFTPSQLSLDVNPDYLASHLMYYHYRNFSAPIASGSAPTAGMIIIPSSMGTIGAIAHGLSETLIHRAADVHLKEHRPLILVPRETPLSTIHLNNLLICSRAGAIILPAMPAFYHQPKTLDDLISFIIAKVSNLFSLPQTFLPTWGPPLQEVERGSDGN